MIGVSLTSCKFLEIKQNPVENSVVVSKDTYETILDLPLPPPEYDHYPLKPMLVLVVPADKINELDDKKSNSEVLLGLTFEKNGGCVIIIPKIGTYSTGLQIRVTRMIQDDVFRHERAHCSGWPADHPDAWKPKSLADVYNDVNETSQK